MEAGKGNDKVEGGPDGDAVYGGPGHDGINGNAGYDLLYDGDGVDLLNGGTENDVLFSDGDSGGGGLRDVFTGGPGNDHLEASTLASGGKDFRGPGDNDTLCCESGPDVLVGASGDDNLRGRGGDDLLACGSGIDSADGGAGPDNDVLIPNHGCETVRFVP